MSAELMEALAVMKSFLHERRFIARDFDLDDWVDPRPLVEAYRLEGLEEVASGLQRSVAGRGPVPDGVLRARDSSDGYPPGATRAAVLESMSALGAEETTRVMDIIDGLRMRELVATSALGSILIPAMERDGYTKRFAAAITAASSVIGPIIPPSIIMVLYALVMNVSVGGLFAAGFVPGLMMGLGLMIAVSITARRRSFPRREKMASPGEMGRAFRRAFLPLLTPVIILGGILSGVFTPTEAAGAAVAYALLISFLITRSMRFGDLKRVLLRAGVASATVLLVVATATLFAGIVTLSGFPNKLSEFVFGLTENPLLLLFMVNVLLLIVGMFLDAGPAILVLGPVLAPTMLHLGVDPLHFAIIMCVNLTVGLATPPMGLVLFVASTLTRLPVLDIARELLPFLVVHIVIIYLVTYFPALSMTLPRLLGFS